MTSGTSKKEFFHHVDLMRFVFSVLIVYYHILHANIIPYVTDPRYAKLAKLNNYSSNIVICFFIISGVFLYRSFRANSDQSVFDYIVSRVIRLWPLMMAAFMLEALLVGNIDWSRTLINAFFLQCSGISLEYRGMLWYVSSFFFASIFLFAILRSFSLRKALFAISLIVYFSCAFLVNYFDGKIGSRETVLYVINIGTLRGVAFIGCGILLAAIQERLQEMSETAPLSRPAQVVLFIAKIVTEALCLLFLYDYFLRSQRQSNHIILVLIFCLLMLCMMSKKDPLGIILNRKNFGFCGKYAYSIYVMQGTGFLILQKTLWLYDPFLSNVPIAIIVSTLFLVAVGIAGYYLVELPCANLYRKWKVKYRSTQIELRHS